MRWCVNRIHAVSAASRRVASADTGRARRRAPGCGGTVQQGHRRPALRVTPHRADPSHPHISQAQRHLASAARPAVRTSDLRTPHHPGNPDPHAELPRRVRRSWPGRRGGHASGNRLLDAAGRDAYDVGPHREGWYLQRDTTSYAYSADGSLSTHRRAAPSGSPPSSAQAKRYRNM